MSLILDLCCYNELVSFLKLSLNWSSFYSKFDSFAKHFERQTLQLKTLFDDSTISAASVSQIDVAIR